MRRSTKLILLLSILYCGTALAIDWQVVLLKPRDCNSCFYVEEILKRNAQLRETVLRDAVGNSVSAKIIRRSSTELTNDEQRELRALPYFKDAAWERKIATGAAMVLLKRDGVIAAAGDIADSADLTRVRLPPELAQPDPQDSPLAVREARSKFLSEVFLRTWNLDWFYQLALNPTLQQPSTKVPPIVQTPPTLAQALGPVNVMLMSTASSAADNEIFNALRIEEIRDRLTGSLAVNADQIHVFYGGDNPHGANALEVRDGRFSLVRRDVQGATAFTPDAVHRIFQSIRARPASRNLLVLIGHGAPEGAGMWSSLTPLAPTALRSLHEQGGGDDVLVSGNCFGGIMARATSCGFFGARPDIVATGCQADAAEVAQSRDYLHTFFSALAPGAQRLVDANNDGAVTFAEAHWHASIEGDVRNVPYTSVDALADAWIEANRGTLSLQRSVAEIRALGKSAPPGEARALGILLAGYDAKFPITLDKVGAQAENWNPATGNPRPLVAQLARRLLFLESSASKEPEALQALGCENRSVAQFLRP